MMTHDVSTTQIIYDLGELRSCFTTRSSTPTEINVVTTTGTGYIFRLDPNTEPAVHPHPQYGRFVGRRGQFVVNERPDKPQRDADQQGGFVGWIGINTQGEFLLCYDTPRVVRKTTAFSVAFV